MKTIALALALFVGGQIWASSEPVEAQTGYEGAIYAACERHGCSGDQLVRVMMCESGGDPSAVNPVTGDTGLFQFNPNTWYAWGGGNIWDPYEQIELAAWAWGNGLGSHWICQ